MGVEMQAAFNAIDGYAAVWGLPRDLLLYGVGASELVAGGVMLASLVGVADARALLYAGQVCSSIMVGCVASHIVRGDPQEKHLFALIITGVAVAATLNGAQQMAVKFKED